MSLFSERYGYTIAVNEIVREEITEDILNAICNCIITLNMAFKRNACSECYVQMNEYLWIYFFNKRKKDFQPRFNVLEDYILSDNEWYEKLNILECAIRFLVETYSSTRIPAGFIRHLNFEFKRLNFAYRIIDNKIVDITSKNKTNSTDASIETDDTDDYTEIYSPIVYRLKESSDNYSSSEIYYRYEMAPFSFFIRKFFRKKVRV